MLLALGGDTSTSGQHSDLADLVYDSDRRRGAKLRAYIVMEWLGHADSEMVRHHYQLNDEVARCMMDQLHLLGEGNGCYDAGEERNS